MPYITNWCLDKNHVPCKRRTQNGTLESRCHCPCHSEADLPPADKHSKRKKKVLNP